MHRSLRKRILRSTLIVWILFLAFGLISLSALLLCPAAIYPFSSEMAPILTLGGIAGLIAASGLAYLHEQNQRLKSRLKREHAFTRTMLDRLPIPVYVKDAEGRYTSGNQPFADLFGLSLKDMIGRKLTDLFPDDEQARTLLARDTEFLATGTALDRTEVQFNVLRQGNSQQLSLIDFRARFNDPEKESVGIVGAVLDVTEIRRAKSIVAQMEHRLQKLADHVPGAMFQYQNWPDGRTAFPFATIGLKSLFEIDPESLREDASALIEKIHPDDLPIMQQEIQRSARNLSVWQSRFRVVHSDGKTRWISGQAAPENQEDGSVLWHGYLSDITASKLAEDTAHQNAELLRAMFENLPDHVYYKDRQSRFLGGNRVWWESRADNLAELIGKTDADYYPKELADELFAAEQRIMETGQTERRRERHVEDNGEVYYLESLKCPFYGPDGSVQGLVGISRDVTEQVELEKNLIRAKEAAEEASKAKSEFLAMMSHEIRTPMNGVIGATSILLNTEMTDEQKEFVRTIQVSGESLLVIINDILDYSKIEADRIELESTSFALNELVEDTADLLSSPASEKSIELLHSVDPKIPGRLTGDPTRLRQILVNLVGNGIKFTEQGEVELRLDSLGSDGENQHTIRFTVRDTGIGIPENRRHRLFQPFSQADASNTRRFGGTGLGLVISQRLVQLMGGNIEFSSEENKGSTFHFTLSLPVCQDARSHIAREITALHGRHIVAVDDNRTNRRILSEGLAQMGLQVSCFKSGDELLNALPFEHPVDAFILDFQMPDMDGVVLAERLRVHPNYTETPIILLSSVDCSPNSDCIDLKISKPAKLTSLKNNLERLISPLEERSPNEPDIVVTPPAASPHRKALHVLVAEDNSINQRIAGMMLERLGHTFTLVENGEAAVEAVKQGAFDLILMDIQMPKLDGLEATRRIRAESGQNGLPPIIALTAGAMESDRQAAISSGMNGFLAKPLKIRQLEEAIADFVRDV